jgi:hypothetical protein
MRRSAYRRAAAPSGGNRRLLAVGAVIAALGAVVAFTTISNAAENDPPAGSGAGKVVNGQTILTDTCVDSKLPPFDGFQNGNRCVSTEFGEVGTAENNPSLLITQAPRQVTVNTPFTLVVSTRNLIRDRFLAAGQGGYYVESSVLRNGIVRGHFHTACRMLASTRVAPAPDPVPAFFVATEDSRGGATPDSVTIQVPGLPTAGTAQCASWAGDGSHRIPMMQRANQTPALDAVRIRVRAAGGNNGGGQQGGNNGGGQQGGNNGGGQQGGNNGGGQQGGNNGGGQQGGNNGGNTGGQQGGNNGNTGGGNGGNTPTTAPTTTAPAPGGTATQPSTKDDFTPNPTKTATVRPTSTRKSSTGKSSSNNSSNNSSSNNDATTSDDNSSSGDVESTETDAPKPKASKSAEAAGTDYTYSNDDGVPNSGVEAPAANQVDAAQQTTTDKQGGLLALTGSNSMAFIGAAVVLMLVGLTVMALTRRRRPGSPWQ